MIATAAARIRIALVHRHPQFGGEDDVIALFLERFAQNFLAMAAAVFVGAVSIGGIEEIDSGIERFVYGLDAAFIAFALIKVHRAPAKPGNHQSSVAILDILHYETPF